jgi:hypothetical protein
VKPNDPCITVYVGWKSPIKENYVGQGHFYLVYDENGLPDRLASTRELKIARTGENPEIWYGKDIVPTRGVD